MEIEPRHRVMLRELSAGVVSASLTLPLCIGAGILAFSPLGAEHVGRGAVAGLYGAIIGGLVAALLRRSSFAVTFPTTPVGALQGSLGASLLPLCGNLGNFALAMTLCLVLVGLFQALFALSGFSRVLRFVPHPVMAGFVSGVAVFVGWHQVPALLGHRTLGEVLQHGLRPQHPAAAALGIGLLALMLAVPRVAPRLPALLLGLLAGGLAFHGALRAWPGIDLGPTIGAFPSPLLHAWPHLDAASLGALLAVPGLLRLVVTGALTIALLGSLDTLFALRAAQFIGEVQVAPRRDVLGVGMANLAMGLTGGLAVSTSFSVSMANHGAGGRTRLSSLACAGTLLLGGLIFPRVITLLPMVVTAAVLLAVSARLVDRWCFLLLRDALTAKDGPRRRRALKDGLVVLAVFLATVLGQPVMGVGVGVGLAGLLFVLDMSRPVVARRREGATLRSKQLRSPSEEAALRERRERLQLLELQGALFFGNAQDLDAALGEVEEGISVVILDCRRVREIDTSGQAVLDQAAARYRKARRRLLVAGGGPEWAARTFAAAGSQPDYVLPSLDAALEVAERHLLALAGPVSAAAPTVAQSREPGASPLLQLGPRLLERLELVTIPVGTVICRAGDPSDRMWILVRGAARVQAPPGSAGLLLTRLGPGSSFGEIGLLEDGPRSADVVAEEELQAYVLTRDHLARILAEDHATGQAVLAAVARQLAQRVREISGELNEAERTG
jgi:MFS superfamily sulfate permease-like transporter